MVLIQTQKCQFKESFERGVSNQESALENPDKHSKFNETLRIH